MSLYDDMSPYDDLAPSAAGRPAPRGGVRVTLLRHGESDHNARGLMQGASDAPELTQKGMAQACAAAVLLPARVDALLVSPLRRARRTLDLIREARPDLPAERVMPALREIDVPDWEGRAFAALDREDGARRRLWLSDPERIGMRRADGRTFLPCADVFERAAQVLGLLRAEPDEAEVVAVAHGGVIRALMALAFGLPRTRLHALAQDNCAVHRIVLTPQGAELLSYNETGLDAAMRVAAALSRPGPVVAFAPEDAAAALSTRYGLAPVRPGMSCAAPRRVMTGPPAVRAAAFAAAAGIPAAAAAALAFCSEAVHALVPASDVSPAVVTLLNAVPSRANR